MKSYRRLNPKVERTGNGRIMLLSKCAVCKSQFIKEQKAREVLSYLTRIKIPFLSDLPVLNAIP